MKSPTKSCLLDPRPTSLVKECSDILLPSITKLINCSLSEGVVLADFKKTDVTPLIKKPHYHQLTYKLGHLTETMLLSIKNDVHLGLAGGEDTAVVLLDQSVAFDTIDHAHSYII